MATATGLPVDALLEQSRTTRVRPGHAVATGIAWIFVALGWIVGATWRGLVFCAVSARYGYWRGLGLTDDDITARIAASNAPPAQPAAGRA